MVVATAPDCACPTPERIDVDSTIENPNDLIASPRAEVTWHLNDPSGEEQAFHTEQIGEAKKHRGPTASTTSMPEIGR